MQCSVGFDQLLHGVAAVIVGGMQVGEIAHQVVCHLVGGQNIVMLFIIRWGGGDTKRVAVGVGRALGAFLLLVGRSVEQLPHCSRPPAVRQFIETG